MASVAFNMGAGKSSAVQTESALETACAKIIASHADGSGYENGATGWLTDLAKGGCESGMVGELVYYRETCAFYETHKADINALLANMLDDMGAKSAAELFADKWDAEDPLALDVQNQNLLAWFAFEETARLIASRLDIEI
jgi:hypothetical protein